jgi:hypothetical protein
MRGAIGSFRDRYGAGPMHLIGLLASLLVAAAAVKGWFERPPSSTIRILIWFAGAIVAHDLLVLPTYSALDRLARRREIKRLRRGPYIQPTHPPGWVYIRLPLLLSALLLLVFGAEILRAGNSTFQVASGLSQNVYLVRYLVACAVLFAISGIAYVVSRVRLRSATDRPPEPTPTPSHTSSLRGEDG